VRLPDGEIVEREVVDHVDAVAVVPLLPDGTVVLLRHYRQPVGTYLLEIPAGKLDEDGESPEEAADRELREETGLAPGDLQLLTVFHNSGGWTTESTHVYLASDVREEGSPEGFEPEGEERDLEVLRLPLDEAVAAVEDGTITDAKTIIGLLLAGDR
jgi:8-oxo-dGDP phosphatase